MDDAANVRTTANADTADAKVSATQRNAALSADYVTQTKSNIKNLQNILTMYALDHDGDYPRGGKEQLSLLTGPTEYHGKRLSAYYDKIPKDAWGEPLYYEYPSSKGAGDKPALWSSGPNFKNDNGSGDDINNWSPD